MDPEIVKRLDALGEKLGATGQYLWDALVRGCFAAGIVWGIALVVLSVVLGYVNVLFRRKLSSEKGSPDEEVFLVGFVISALACVVCFLGGMHHLVDAIAPERAAIKIIFGK